MRISWRIAAALSVAVALGAVCGARAEANEVGPDSAHVLLFSGTDVWHQGGFAHAGLLWAPSGLDREGLVLKLMFGGGAYHYNSGGLGNVRVRGDQLSGMALAGYRLIHDNLTVTVFLGYYFQQHRLTPDDPFAGLRGGYLGVRTGFELWYQPTVATMIAADASISTIGTSYNARLAAGVRAFDLFYIGPEIQGFSADSNYRQLRAGLHITGFQTGNFEWSGGAGWAIDTDDHDGAYGKLSVLTRY